MWIAFWLLVSPQNGNWAHLLMKGKCSSIHGRAVLLAFRKAYSGAKVQTRLIPKPRSGETKVNCSGIEMMMLRICVKTLAVAIEVALTTRSTTYCVSARTPPSEREEEEPRPGCRHTGPGSAR